MTWLFLMRILFFIISYKYSITSDKRMREDNNLCTCEMRQQNIILL